MVYAVGREPRIRLRTNLLALCAQSGPNEFVTFFNGFAFDQTFTG
jgi:hypothetical protein